MKFRSMVSIGDSFTEGLGDQYQSGLERGWADLVAFGIADYQRSKIGYANLAIRGRKLAGVEEQLAPALELSPALLTINGGGNDMLRPSMKVDEVSKRLQILVETAVAAGSHVLLLSGGDPGGHLPFGKTFHERGAEMTEQITNWGKGKSGITVCNNFADQVIAEPDNWFTDGLHLNSRGHARVARNVLNSLEMMTSAVDATLAGLISQQQPAQYFGTAKYYREFIMPWIGRRLRRRSSGDGRTAKFPEYQTVSFESDTPFQL